MRYTIKSFKEAVNNNTKLNYITVDKIYIFNNYTTCATYGQQIFDCITEIYDQIKNINYKDNDQLFDALRDHHFSEYISGIFCIYENTKHMTIRLIIISYIKFIKKQSLPYEAQSDII